MGRPQFPLEPVPAGVAAGGVRGVRRGQCEIPLPQPRLYRSGGRPAHLVHLHFCHLRYDYRRHRHSVLRHCGLYLHRHRGGLAGVRHEHLDRRRAGRGGGHPVRGAVRLLRGLLRRAGHGGYPGRFVPLRRAGAAGVHPVGHRRLQRHQRLPGWLQGPGQDHPVRRCAPAHCHLPAAAAVCLPAAPQEQVWPQGVPGGGEPPGGGVLRRQRPGGGDEHLCAVRASRRYHRRGDDLPAGHRQVRPGRQFHHDDYHRLCAGRHPVHRRQGLRHRHCPGGCGHHVAALWHAAVLRHQ